MLGSELPVLSTSKKGLIPQGKPAKALPLGEHSFQEVRGMESEV